MKARYLILLTTLAFLGFSVSAVAHPCQDGDDPLDHKHCRDAPTSPPEPLTLPVCDHDEQLLFCIASVGKWHRQAASDYAAVRGGSYTEIHSGDFDNILAALPEDDFLELCKAYDVLVFEWNSTNMNNLTWQSLVNYMACGGGVLFEDTNNVADLSDGVTIEEINVHDRRKSPLTIAFDTTCPIATLCAQLPNQTGDEFEVVNNHIVFAEGHSSTNPYLFPFLRLPSSNEDNNGAVLGLYGEYLNEQEVWGRIVLTGPDNNYHGSDCQDVTDPYCSAKSNQYELLFHEIDWLRGL
jgi:hypothetical protein